jgi:hypothetical protein
MLSSSTQHRHLPLSESDHLFRYNIPGRSDKLKPVFVLPQIVFNSIVLSFEHLNVKTAFPVSASNDDDDDDDVIK